MPSQANACRISEKTLVLAFDKKLDEVFAAAQSWLLMNSLEAFAFVAKLTSRPWCLATPLPVGAC
jgi:hypothetical protein